MYLGHIVKIMAITVILADICLNIRLLPNESKIMDNDLSRSLFSHSYLSACFLVTNSIVDTRTLYIRPAMVGTE